MIQTNWIDGLNLRLAVGASFGTILDKLSTAISLSMPNTKETNVLANIFLSVLGVPLGCLVLIVASIVLIMIMLMLSRSVTNTQCKMTGTIVLALMTLVFGICFLNNIQIIIG
jgi:hypothetical protein